MLFKLSEIVETFVKADIKNRFFIIKFLQAIFVGTLIEGQEYFQEKDDSEPNHKYNKRVREFYFRLVRAKLLPYLAKSFWRYFVKVEDKYLLFIFENFFVVFFFVMYSYALGYSENLAEMALLSESLVNTDLILEVEKTSTLSLSETIMEIETSNQKNKVKIEVLKTDNKFASFCTFVLTTGLFIFRTTF